ncbi:response regulator transcription factor [Agrococcus sp. Ld7]|uniref:helix-turn-helix transcriptional regulator n=1 Tax=Agrococcus sp. Ld7 TaxID=649148 RepID=UPI00386AA91A
MREDTFTTSPYAVFAVTVFALAVAMSRSRPSWSMVAIGLVLVAQLLFWPARLGQTSWIAYLILVPAAVAISRYVRTGRRGIHLAGVIAAALAVAALLAVPALSFKGTEGTITGSPWPSPEAIQSLAICVVVCVGLALAGWALGRPRAVPDSPTLESLEQPVDPGFESLSPRERDIFRLVARGLPNADVAKEMFVSEATVKTHVGSVLAKLKLASRNELIVYAYERGIVRPAHFQR